MADRRQRSWRRSRRPRRCDGGFALVEYVISVAIMGVIVGVLSAAVVVVVRNQNSSVQRNDASNGAIGVTNYFPTDIAATPPGGRETSASLTTGCTGYSDDGGYNLIRLTWSETLSSGTTQYRVAYRLIGTGDTGEVRRVSCSGTGGTYGSANTRKVAFGLAAVPKPWTAGVAPAVLSPLSGDGGITLTLSALNGTTYTVQGSRLNPSKSFAPYVPPGPNAAVETTFTLAVANYSTVGEVLTYTNTITNTGGVALSGVGRSYSNATASTSCASVLSSGVTVTCAATHTVTQSDLDTGAISASVDSYGYYGSTAVTATASNTIPAAAAPSVSVLLASASPGYTAAGQVLTYTMTVTNNGNITLTGFTPAYTNATPSGNCSATALAPGASATCTATHTVTSDEYTATISATGSAYGTTANFGNTATVTTSALDVPFLPTPTITVNSFTASPSPFTTLGETITYTLTLTNTGNVDLTGVGATYTNATEATACATALAIGATSTCTATYVVTQSDIDNGGATNTATATGAYLALTTTATATTEVPPVATASVSVLLTTTATSFRSVGEVIPFTLNVTNTGNVTIVGIARSFSNATASDLCSPQILAPGATATCAASHTVVAADLGTAISTTGSAFGGTFLYGDTGTVTSSPISVAFQADPQIAVSTFTASPSPFTGSGQVVTFSVTIRNAGNVALTNVSLGYTDATGSGACASSLAIGATATCTSTHTTTTTEAVTGFTNVVTASGLYSTTTVSAQSTLTVPSAQPCVVTSATNNSVANPTSVGRVPNNSAGKKDMLLDNVVITLTTSGTCTGLRIKYYPKSPSSVLADLTLVSSGVWTYTVPGQNGSSPATWNSGNKKIEVLPASAVGNTPIYTNTSTFTVT